MDSSNKKLSSTSSSSKKTPKQNQLFFEDLSANDQQIIKSLLPVFASFGLDPKEKCEKHPSLYFWQCKTCKD